MNEGDVFIATCALLLYIQFMEKYPKKWRYRLNFWSGICLSKWEITGEYSDNSFNSKVLSLYNKLWFSNPYIFSIQCRRPLIFQTMKYVRSNNLSLKYQMFTPSSCRDIGIKKFKFVAKTQFLCFCKFVTRYMDTWI